MYCKCAQWYNSVFRGGGHQFYLVSSSTGVVIPSICSPLSDFETTVSCTHKCTVIPGMTHRSMTHFSIYR